MRVSLCHRALGLGLGFFAVGCTPGAGGGGSSTGMDTDSCTPGTLHCRCEASVCEAGLVCASGICIPDDDTSATSLVSTSGITSDVTSSGSGTGPGTTASTGESMSTSTGAPTECDDGPGPSPSCPAEAPFCTAEGVCADCTGIPSCADVDPQAPVCDAASGQCVQCTASATQACGGATPICDPATNTCVACEAHAQCPSGACDFATGECFPEAGALWVDANGPCGSGTEDDPFCEIQDAVGTLAPGSKAVVHVRPGTYKTKIDVDGGVVVAIVGEGGAAPALDVGKDALLVNENARVYLDRLRIVGSAIDAAKGLVCLNAKVWADSVEITSREGGAIHAIGCQLRLRRDRIYLNPGGGLLLDKGSVYLENTFVTSNGGSFSMYGGMSLTGGVTVEAVYTTIVGNNADDTVAESIHCAGNGTVVLRNSIMFGQSQGTSFSCDASQASDSVVDSPLLEGGENVVIEPTAQSQWFKNAAGGDFHVTPSAPFADRGVWRAGDPGVDYDGDVRPTVDASSDWAGADRLP